MCRKVAIIFAGGVGSRLYPSDKPKQFMLLSGKPVIIHTIELFEQHESVTDIIVVCLESWIDELKKMLREYGIQKVRNVVSGGRNTQESIYNGLCEAEKLTKEENAVVLIHDGVRPLICAQTISDNIESVVKHGSCITCALPTETIVLNETEKIEVPRRRNLLVARAPQSFCLKDIIETHRQAIADGNMHFIDCCEMMHHYGHSLNMVLGPAENLKITTIADFYMCEALMKLRNSNEQ